jgi:NADH-quinone oxidoreductase subunit J
MIGAIVLTLRHRTGVKRQRIYKQISRKRSDAVEVVSVQSGEGV